ncbi:unnamed protein product, partial [Adineta ricciae]
MVGNLLLVVFFVQIPFVFCLTYRPVVLMHGITSTASAMEDIARWVRSLYPDIYVVSIEIGNGKVDSYLLPLDVQVEKFCEAINSNPRLREG